MRIFEIFEDLSSIDNETILVSRMKNFDWLYEFAGDLGKIDAGNEELNLIEHSVYALWKSKPEHALNLWFENCPHAKEGVVPSFIYRLSAQEDYKQE